MQFGWGDMIAYRICVKETSRGAITRRRGEDSINIDLRDIACEWNWALIMSIELDLVLAVLNQRVTTCVTENIVTSSSLSLFFFFFFFSSSSFFSTLLYLLLLQGLHPLACSVLSRIQLSMMPWVSCVLYPCLVCNLMVSLGVGFHPFLKSVHASSSFVFLFPHSDYRHIIGSVF
jgi:hypothetical protein